jgi:D-alanine-D-alanine ligase
MRLCTLVSSYEQGDSPFRGLDPYPDPSLWAPDDEWDVCLVDKATAASTVRDLSRRGFDAFGNLCDGSAEEPLAGVEVIHELERLDQAYTGASSRFFEPSRKAMKRLCRCVGVDTPRYRFARGSADAAIAAAHLRFPILVKPPNGFGSIGLTAESRVTTVDALLALVERMVAQHGGALLEEFIEGREFTVLVAEPGEGERAPRGYPPIEVMFPPGESFKHFNLKWLEYAGLGARPVEDAGLVARLQRVAALIFEGFQGTGYARCDVRMDSEGRLYLLDVNPNPGVFYPPSAPGSADLILGHDPGGHRAFIAHIVAAALRRRDERRLRSGRSTRPLHATART